MKVELGFKAASSVVAVSGCPKISEQNCGIMYRAH